MLNSRGNIFTGYAIKLAIFIPFLLLFVNERALAQIASVIAERPHNPKTGCPRRSSGHHAERLATSINPDQSPVETSDTSFEVEAYIFVGNKARDAGKYEEANGYYRQALAINPREWRAHYGLGNVFFDQALLARATNQPIDVSKSSMANAIEEYKRAAELGNTDEQRESTEVAELYAVQSSGKL